MMDAAPPAPLPGLDFDLLFAALPAPCAVLSADGTTVLALNAALRRCLPAAPATPAPVAALQAAAAAAGRLPLALAPVPATGPPRYVLGSWSDAAAAGPAGEEKTPADWHRQLAAEQARHQYLLDQTPALIASFAGPDHRLGCANARFEGAFGHSARPGTTLAERYPEVLAQGFGARLDAVYRSGETLRGDGVPLEAHDPTTGQLRRFYFDITCQALRDPAGPITGVLLFAVDVTGRVLAQQAAAAAEIQVSAAAAAQASALRLLRVAESQPNTSFVVNADGGVAYVSPQWYAYTGTPPGADIGAVWPALIHPDDLPVVTAAFGVALASGTPWSYDFRLRGADGHYRWFASQGRPEPLAEAQAAGRPRQWFGSNRDIDERKRAQAALQAQETRLASILDQLPLTISTVEGPDLRFTFLSAMAKVQMGPRAQVGRLVAECLPEIAAQGYTALLAKVRDTGQPVRGYEERSTLQDPTTGELHEVFNNFGFLPLHGADGAVAGVLAYGLNVTEQVQSRRAAEVLGVEAIRQACRLAVHRKPGAAVIAEVLPRNQAALTAFDRAGFSVEHAVGRADAVRMVWRQPNEQTSTATHYRQLLAEHGDSFKALNWGSEAGQLLRFEILAGVGDLRGSAVLDVGCGLAHFADWLERRGIGVDYTGLDLVPALLEAAATRRPDLRLVQGSILDSDVLQGERFDYVFASGVFATYEAGAESVLRASVARMWELARKGVAFNALSAQASDREPGEYHADPVAVLAFCKTLAPRAQLIEGYHPRDFTIHLPRVAAGR